MNDVGNGMPLLQLIPKKELDFLSTQWEMDKHVRHFTLWKQLRFLLISEVLNIKTLREIESVFGISHSTFNDACLRRDADFFWELCQVLLWEVHKNSASRKLKKGLRNLLVIDSTEIAVHGSMASLKNWKSGEGAGAKLHVTWNFNKECIEDYRITGKTENDLTIAKTFQIQSNVMYVFDRAYVDLGFWLAIMGAGSDFVTRLKKTPRHNGAIKAVLAKKRNETGVLWEGEWTPSETSAYRYDKKPKELKFRQVIYRDPERGHLFHFITSDFQISAQEVADIYRRRWSVELLFRWLKSHLNLRKLGTKNINSTSVLIATAALVQILTQLYRLKQKLKETSWQCLRNLRASLVTEGLRKYRYDSS